MSRFTILTNGSPVAGNTVCAIQGPVTEDLTLTDDVMYRMLGKVDVGIDMGTDGTKDGGVSATLTIPAGVVIMGKVSDDYIVINRGSKIIAMELDQSLLDSLIIQLLKVQLVSLIEVYGEELVILVKPQ